MSHPRPPRALTPTQINDLGRDLIDLAAILARPDAPRTQATIAAAASPDGLRSALAATHGGNGGSEGPPLPLPHTDPTTRFAAELLTELHRLRTDIPVILAALRGWSPGRATHVDPRCGHGLAPGQTVCTRVLEDGTRCGAIHVELQCRSCGTEVPAGQRRRGLCNACRQAVPARGYTAAAVRTGPIEAWTG